MLFRQILNHKQETILNNLKEDAKETNTYIHDLIFKELQR